MIKLGSDLVVQRNPSTKRELSASSFEWAWFQGFLFSRVSNLGRPVHPLPAVWTRVILECQNSKVSKIGFDHPKDAGGLGDLGKRVFGPKFPKFKGKNSDFRFRVGFLLRATHFDYVVSDFRLFQTGVMKLKTFA